MGGIDRENENMVIAARTGIGKTQTMVKMAVAASQQGLTVGIFEGEMTEDKIGYRVDTFLGGISNSAINRGELFVNREYKNHIDSLASRHLGAIKVITPNSVGGKVTVNTLRSFIIKEQLDILFVDQYSLLEDTSHARTSFERVGNIAKEIKQLQVEFKIPIIAVSQMNRTKNEDGTQDTTQIGLSDMIPQYATILIMLDRKDDQLILNIVKSRDGGDNKKLTYHADFNTGLFTFLATDDKNLSQATGQELQERYQLEEDNSDGNIF